MGYLQWSSEAVPAKNEWMCADFSSSATPDAYCQVDLLPWRLTLLSILLQEFKNIFMLNGCFVAGWSNCQRVQQKGAHLLPITHTGTEIQIIFFSNFVQQRMCLQHICCHNQVFSQGYLVRSEEYKAIIFGSELLPDCVCNSTEVIAHYIREPEDSFSPSLYQALKKLEIVFT